MLGADRKTIRRSAREAKSPGVATGIDAEKTGGGDVGDQNPSVWTCRRACSSTPLPTPGFFEGDYRFTDAWTLTVGGRYTHDKKDTGLIDPSMPELAVAGGIDNPVGKSWSEFTPKVSLKYKLSPDVKQSNSVTRPEILFFKLIMGVS
jgi:outer membrane receptor protein involved in Fe transport